MDIYGGRRDKFLGIGIREGVGKFMVRVKNGLGCIKVCFRNFFFWFEKEKILLDF